MLWHRSPVMSNEAAWYIEDDIMNSVLNLEKQVRAMPVDQVNMEVERLIKAAQKEKFSNKKQVKENNHAISTSKMPGMRWEYQY